MTSPILIPCPRCSGTATDTHEDRHAETGKDTCPTCGGARVVPSQTGETRAGSFDPVSGRAFGDVPADPIERLAPGCTKADVDEALAALPAALAGYADAAEAKIRAMGIDPPARCASCAFTAGTFPNTKAPATALDALKCLVEDHPFGCHHDKGADGKPTRLCAGFRMVMAAETGPKLAQAPWKWSDEIAGRTAAEASGR